MAVITDVVGRTGNSVSALGANHVCTGPLAAHTNAFVAVIIHGLSGFAFRTIGLGAVPGSIGFAHAGIAPVLVIFLFTLRTRWFTTIGNVHTESLTGISTCGRIFTANAGIIRAIDTILTVRIGRTDLRTKRSGTREEAIIGANAGIAAIIRHHVRIRSTDAAIALFAAKTAQFAIRVVHARVGAIDHGADPLTAIRTIAGVATIICFSACLTLGFNIRSIAITLGAEGLPAIGG